MRNWKAVAAKVEVEEGDPGGHGPRTCRSAVQDENLDSGKRNLDSGKINFEAGSVLLVFQYRTSSSPVFVSGNAYIRLAIIHALCSEKPGRSHHAYVCQGVSALYFDQIECSTLKPGSHISESIYLPRPPITDTKMINL